MSRTEWRETELGAVATVSWGDTTTTKAAYTDSGFVAYSASGPDGFLPYADHHADGVVVSAIGAQCGKTWFASGDWSCIKNTMWLRSKDESVLTRYLYFATGDPSRWPRRGAAQPFIALTDAKRFPLALPDLRSQKMICWVLGSLDDLIENNQRRIEILEEMAQAIYREWFVEFRYPGHEDVPLVDSDLGLIPEGWVTAPIGHVVETVGGGTPAKGTPDYWDPGTIEWFTPTDLTAAKAMFASGSGLRISDLGLAKSSAKLFPARSVMMTSRATIGEIAIATAPASTNQGFITCIPNERLSEYHLYFWLSQNVEMFKSVASGATFKEINKSTFRAITVAVPPPPVEAAFSDLVSSICELVARLLRANQNLRTTRDLLLPRLISGEVDVSGLDLDLDGLVA